MRWIGVVAVSLFALALGVSVGPADIAFASVLDALAGKGDAVEVAIVRNLRVPRALLAFLVGGSLAITGAALQALIRNPLAEPYLLGLSGGAGLGAVIAIAFNAGGVWSVPLAASIGALGAIVLVYRLALVTGGVLDTRVLLFAGVVVSAFSMAIMGAILAIAPAAELRNAMLWILGGFNRASWRTVSVFALYASIPLALFYWNNRSLDLISLGEEPAQFLGANVERLKRLLYILASVLTAAAVAVSGMIGFVGLVVPHAVRMVWGHTHQTLLPAAFLLGGTLLVIADSIARTLFSPTELPVGTVTALIGVPVFVVLVRRWAK